MSLLDVSKLPELVRDTYLEANVGSSTTVHTFEESPRPRREEWSHKTPLGRGGFGEVSLEECIGGLKPNSPRLRAVKKIALQHDSEIPNYVRELEAMAKFSQSKFSSFFPKLFGWYQANDKLFISMEYFPMGDLQTYLTKSDRFTEDHIVSVTQQVVRALRFMHNEGFAHRDLKLANIMLTSEPPEWQIKLIDFGNSKRFNKGTQKLTAIIGTVDYIAPDILARAKKYDLSSSVNPEDAIPQEEWLAGDIWSLGEIVVRLFSKKPSFANERKLMQYFCGEAAFPVELLESVGSSTEAMDFVQLVMKAKPASRITIQEAAAHSWLKMTDTLATSKMVSNVRSTISSTQIEGLRYCSLDTTSDVSLQSLQTASPDSTKNQGTLNSRKFKTNDLLDFATGYDLKNSIKSFFGTRYSPVSTAAARGISDGEAFTTTIPGATGRSMVTGSDGPSGYSGHPTLLLETEPDAGHTTYSSKAEPTARSTLTKKKAYLAVYSTNAKYLITVSDDKIRVWMMEKMSLLAEVLAPSSRAKAVTCYTSSSNTTIFIAMILHNGDVVFGDIKQDATLRTVSIDHQKAISIAMDKEHNMIALGCSDRSIIVIDVETSTWKDFYAETEGDCTIKWIFFLQHKYPLMMTICSGGTLRLWEYYDFLWSQVGHQRFDEFEHLAFDSVCRRLLMTRGHIFEVWDACSRHATSLYKFGFATQVSDLCINSIHFNLNDYAITKRTEDGSSQFWKGGDNIPVFTISSPYGPGDCVAVSPSWPCKVVTNADGNIGMSHLKIGIKHKEQTIAYDTYSTATYGDNRNPRARIMRCDALESIERGKQNCCASCCCAGTYTYM